MTANITADRTGAAPVEQLVDALGGEFGPLKAFRPYKDVRFSADKRPYKDHFGLVSADQSGTAYYLQVSQHGLTLAGGLYQPEREQLARFREIVDDNSLVGDLEVTLDEVGAHGFAIMVRMSSRRLLAASALTTRRSACCA